MKTKQLSSASKNLEQLTKKELIKLVVKVRPKADAYDRVCESLGIKNNILSEVDRLKNGDKKFNVNSCVKLKITEKGLKRWKDHYNDFPKNLKIKPITIQELRNKQDNDGYISLQLWEVMEIFGEDLQVHDYFDTTITISGKDLK
jgi:hypothetical protein